MKDEITLSRLPDSWGGPFIWSRNERGNLELVRISDLTDSAHEVFEIIREQVAR